MMNSVRTRIGKLEDSIGRFSHGRSRVFRCIVRQNREDEDQASAFQALGMSPQLNDLLVRRVIVSPDPSAAMDDITPYAEQVAGPTV